MADEWAQIISFCFAPKDPEPAHPAHPAHPAQPANQSYTR